MIAPNIGTFQSSNAGLTREARAHFSFKRNNGYEMGIT